MDNNIITNKYNYFINKYDIFIDIDTINLHYEGSVLINLTLLNNINNIKINSSGIEISSIKINQDKIDIWEENEKDEYILINKNFSKGTHMIFVEFKNSIGEEMDGIYYCRQDNNLIICTHLEPISARKFIPCFDEPDLKAVFNMTVTIDNEYNVVSNSSINNIVVGNELNKVNEFNKSNKEKNNRKRIFFNPTPKMSTYLLCLVAGNISKALDNSLITKTGIKVNGYSILSNIKELSWSILHTAKSLDFFTKWFGIKYPLDKLDIVSIPNFSSGAMENWGLVTFREEYILLYDKENYLSKIKILEVIYHEIAHQWFGNLVTMDDWNSLWLNESTATYFSWMALEIVYKDYFIPELYWLLECKNVLISDGMINTHAIVIDSTKENNNSPDAMDPKDLFDEITYSKGNYIIRYISQLLGINNFQKSINKYLSSNLYSNTKSSELYSYFNEFSTNKQIDYVELMNNLVKTKGYPILYIQKQNQNYHIVLKKFNLDKKLETEYPHEIWIKITYLEKQNDLVGSTELKYSIIKLKPGYNQIPNYITENKFVINPDNTLFCICEYNLFIPYLEIMNQNEIMKYLHDKFILCLYNYFNLSDYLNLILFIFGSVNLKKNYLFLFQIILDLIKIFEIYVLSDKNNDCLLKFIKKNLSKYWIEVLEWLILFKPKYYQMVVDKIFCIESIYIESLTFGELIIQSYKMFYEEKKIANCYFQKTLFLSIIKYHQDEQLDNLLGILSETTDPNIISNIIESFSMLNDKNFDIIISKYKQLIKSQDYDLFFWSISKICSKQKFIINYWIKERDNLSTNHEIQYKILKKISLNIYNLNLIDYLLNYVNSIYSIKYKLVFGKIIDVLNYNKITSKNFNY
jgi:hypothetical protein